MTPAALSAMRLFVCALLFGAGFPSLSAQEVVTGREARSVIRVNSTCQPFDFLRPWAKKAPFTRSGVGAILPDGRVLVTAEMVADFLLLELEIPGSAEKGSAELLAVDHEANLALLQASDPDFLKKFEPMDLAAESTVGERLEVWQLEPNGTLIRTEALLTNVAVQSYPMDGVSLLAFQLTSALQQREGSFTLPLTREGKLAGFSMRFDPRTQNLQAIPTSVIRHFLDDADTPPYRGFPKAGITFASTRDPMFRRHIGLDGQGGVYVTEVQAGGPGEKAGVQEGDVVLSIAGKKLDRDGNYEHPVHGKVSLIHLVSGEQFAGDEVEFGLLREGESVTARVRVEEREAQSFVSPPHSIGRPPRFLIVGGLLFQELSKAYLREFGANWESRANQRLVYYDRYQNTLFPEGARRIVFLRGVIPTEGTLGYGQLDSLVVTRVNGKEILRLEDLDAALETPDAGFHRIEFEDDPGLIFLSVEAVERENQTVRQVYGLPLLRRLEP